MDDPGSPSQSFVDWVESRLTNFLLYPPTLELENIIRLLLIQSRLDGKRVQLMVSDRKALNDRLKEPLNINFFLPLGDSPRLRTSLQLEAIIIIDRLTIPGLSILSQSRKAHLLFLGTRDSNLLYLENLARMTPEGETIGYAILNLSDLGPRLEIQKEETILSPDQEEAYQRRRQEEIRFGQKIRGYTPSSSDEYTMKNYIHSSMVSNFLYPENWPIRYSDDSTQFFDYQRILEKESRQRREFRKQAGNSNVVHKPLPESQVPSDIDQSEGGWMRTELLNQLEKYSPKIRQLLTILQLNSNQRSVIYTHYLNRNGLHLLTTLFQYSQIPTVTLIGADSKEDRISKINDFNQYPKGILITTIIPPVPILNISHLHLLERFSIQTYLSIRDKIYKKKYFSLPIAKVIFHFYVTKFQERSFDFSETADQIFYYDMINVIQLWNSSIRQLADKSNLVGVDSANQLTIIDFRTERSLSEIIRVYQVGLPLTIVNREENVISNSQS